MLTPSGSSYTTQDIDVPVTRKMSADISLENRQSVILGGLTTKNVVENESGIPILKDIPWVGRYLFGKTVDMENRKELLVFMTPYVLDDADAAQAEAIRRKQTLSESRPWEDHGWSKSKLADPVSTKEKLRRQAEEWKKQDKEYAAQLEMEKAQGERVKELEKRAQERTLERARDAAAIAEEFNAAEEKAAKERAEKDLEVRTNNAELLERLGDESRATEAK
jgi:type II secretory pathway component GspD/PulD (secretin)